MKINNQIKRPKEYFEETKEFEDTMRYSVIELKGIRSRLKSIVKYNSKGLLMCDYSNLIKLALVEKALYRKKEEVSIKFNRLLDLPFHY